MCEKNLLFLAQLRVREKTGFSRTVRENTCDAKIRFHVKWGRFGTWIACVRGAAGVGPPQGSSGFNVTRRPTAY